MCESVSEVESWEEEEEEEEEEEGSQVLLGMELFLRVWEWGVEVV